MCLGLLSISRVFGFVSISRVFGFVEYKSCVWVC